MGYRSEVTIVLERTIARKLKEENKKLYDFLHSADTVISTSYEPPVTIFQWDWIKWYDDYDEVKMVNEFLSTLKFDDYLIIIIGEDYDDMTVEGGLTNNKIKITRHVSIW